MSKSITWEEAVVWLREQPGKTGLVKDCYFDDPLLASCERYYASPEWREVRRHAGRPGRVLDVGAGRGIASYAFARDGWQVSALEPDTSGLVGSGAIREVSRLSGLNIEVVETFGENLPFAAGTFDVVFARQVLHHASDLGAFCREAGRVLRPGGRLLGVREHVISKEEDLPEFLRSHPLHELYGGEHAYLLERYLQELKNAGFHVRAVLNPLASEMNTSPLTLKDIKRRIAGKLKWPWPAAIPSWVLKLWGGRMKQPGRIYSFVAVKTNGSAYRI